MVSTKALLTLALVVCGFKKLTNAHLAVYFLCMCGCALSFAVSIQAIICNTILHNKHDSFVDNWWWKAHSFGFFFVVRATFTFMIVIMIINMYYYYFSRCISCYYCYCIEFEWNTQWERVCQTISKYVSIMKASIL